MHGIGFESSRLRSRLALAVVLRALSLTICLRLWLLVHQVLVHSEPNGHSIAYVCVLQCVGCDATCVGAAGLARRVLSTGALLYCSAAAITSLPAFVLRE